MKLKKTVLITGASSGIGYELSLIFAQNGYNLILTARNKKKLNNLSQLIKEKYGVMTKVIIKDLSSQTSAKEIFEELKKAKLKIDILVNNAGFGIHGPFIKTSSTKESEMMQVNMASLTELTKLILPMMIKNKSGKILNVASVAAFLPGPLMSIYYASKAFVLSFSLALSKEIKKHGISVSVLCPGPTKTGFEKTAKATDSILFRFLTKDPEFVARSAYKGLMKKRKIIIPGVFNKLNARLAPLLPKTLILSIVNYMQRTKK